jgi:hypothetical protein
MRLANLLGACLQRCHQNIPNNQVSGGTRPTFYQPAVMKGANPRLQHFGRDLNLVSAGLSRLIWGADLLCLSTG